MDKPCLRKVRGPGCLHCGQRKVGCSLVGLKQKILEEKEGKRRLLSEGLEEGSVAPLELSDRVMEQVEAMAKELRRKKKKETIERKTEKRRWRE
jgi:hypothetical protein